MYEIVKFKSALKADGVSGGGTVHEWVLGKVISPLFSSFRGTLSLSLSLF